MRSRVAGLGFAFGLPLAIAANVVEHAAALPIPAQVSLEGTTKSLAIPALALAYGASLTLLFHRFQGLLRAIAPAGRMALTNYLSHSVAGVIVFYGIGFDWFGRVPLVIALAGAVAMFVLQMVASRLWLTRATFGPVEWLWRMFTYRRRFRLLI